MGKKAKRPSQRMRRAGETNDAVDRILRLDNMMADDLRKWPHDGIGNAVRMRRGITPIWNLAFERAYGAEKLTTLLDRAASHAVVDLWRRQGRVAFDLHLEMANSLYRTDLKGKLPGELFSRLPYINPMIPLPRAWPLNFSDGAQGLVRAIFLTGHIGRAFCPTTDPRSEGLCVVPWIDLNPQAPSYHEILTPIFPLPTTNGPFTFDDVIDHSNAFHGVEGTDKQEQRKQRRIVKQVIPGALSLLTYLCCSNADIQEPPPAQTRTRQHRAPSRDPFYIQVGWRIGPKLHARRERMAGRIRDGVSIPTGVEQDPQQRCGHYKTIWFGPGRKQWDVKWLNPYWTKLDTLDDEDYEPGTMVVPVDPQHGDPSSHKDIRRANLGTTKANEIAKRERQRAREEGWDF